MLTLNAVPNVCTYFKSGKQRKNKTVRRLQMSIPLLNSHFRSFGLSTEEPYTIQEGEATPEILRVGVGNWYNSKTPTRVLDVEY